MLPASTFETLFNQSAAGGYVLSPSDDPVFLAVSDAFLRTVGRTREQLVGMRLFDAFPGDPTDTGDTGVDALRGSLARVLASGTADVLHAQRYPVLMPRADGTTAFEERFWRATSTPIFDSAGSLLCIEHTNEDVTEEVRLNEALRQSKREVEAERIRLQAIVDTIPTGLIIIDENGAFALENPEWKRTWAGNGVVNGVVDYDSYKGFRPDTGERIGAMEWPCAVSLKQGIETRDVVLDIERFNGTRGTIVVSSSPLRDEDGKVIGAVAANMDISELREAQTRLVEADRRKDEFLVMLSHELRNPLAPIRTSLYVLNHAEPDGPQARKAREVIDRQVTQLSRLVDDLLDVSRIARGKIEVRKKRLDIAALVRRTAEDYTSLMSMRKLELVIEGDSDVFVDADETRIVQVLGNLLSNAAKFTPQGGRVTVTTTGDGERARLHVKDTGCGIAPELLPRIFEAFTQANQDMARSEGGLGLGLALVKGIVELHGGEVWAVSDPAQGSDFAVELPLAQTPAATHETPVALSSGSRKRTYRVLVVDDNVDAADSLADLVRLFGHEPEVEYDGRSAVARAESASHDVVFCDIGLPGMDGYQVARELRAKLGVRPRLVAISGYAQPEDVDKAVQAGFDAHIAKPATPRQIERLFASLD